MECNHDQGHASRTCCLQAVDVGSLQRQATTRYYMSAADHDTVCNPRQKKELLYASYQLTFVAVAQLTESGVDKAGTFSRKYLASIPLN